MVGKREVAQKLARVHYDVEPGMTRIFTIAEIPEVEDLPGTPIKLLEVNAGTVPAGVMPLYFGPVPASGIPYPSIIVEVTPVEFEQIQSNKLRLPDGWTIGEELPRSGDNGAA